MRIKGADDRDAYAAVYTVTKHDYLTGAIDRYQAEQRLAGVGTKEQIGHILEAWDKVRRSP